MEILDTSRNQYAVYWEPVGTDDFGKPLFAAPVNVRVRWDGTTEIVKTRTGVDYASRARVALGQDVIENGVLWLGPNGGTDTTDPLGGLDAAHQDDPFKNSGAYKIQRFDKIPTLEADDFYRVAYL